MKPKMKRMRGGRLALLQLTESERLNLQRLGAEIRASNMEYELKQGAADAYIKTVDPDGKYHKLIGEAMSAQSFVKKYVLENNALVEMAGRRLGIDLRTHSFDPETGVVHELGELMEERKPAKMDS
jgi:hypothetical protein